MGFHVDKNVMVPMRDGVKLATDLWIPDSGDAVPALLVRIPYGKDAVAGTYPGPPLPNISMVVDAGYAVVVQDCRGTSGSEGEFTALANEPEDGADTIAWLRQQPWCDGTIGAFGGSYLGITQWASAAEAPEGLKAIAPTAATTDLYTAPFYSDGGALSYHMAWLWGTTMALMDAQRAVRSGTGDSDTFNALVAALSDDQEAQLQAMPSEQKLLTAYWPWYSDWIVHEARDSYWQELSVADRMDVITTPALQVCGWFDFFVNNTARTFSQMKSKAATAEAREGQRLIIGPWDHRHHLGAYPDRHFGLLADAAVCDLTGAHLRFFDRWLRGRERALDGTAPVRIFVMGIDQWRDEPDWPLPDTRYVDYYLDSGGTPTPRKATVSCAPCRRPGNRRQLPV